MRLPVCHFHSLTVLIHFPVPAAYEELHADQYLLADFHILSAEFPFSLTDSAALFHTAEAFLPVQISVFCILLSSQVSVFLLLSVREILLHAPL